MTEPDWWACQQPQEMLAFLRKGSKFSERKARLFAVAACRRVWHLLVDERSRQAVELAERFADGLTSREVMQAANEAALFAEDAAQDDAFARTGQPGADSEFTLAAAAAHHASGHAPSIGEAARCVEEAACWGDSGRSEYERATQANLLRDIFFSPFRPEPVIAECVRAWNGGCIPGLAAAIYEEAGFDRLPVLGDALEEAGVTDEEVLGHCRRPATVHVRGCWLVDILLDKE